MDDAVTMANEVARVTFLRERAKDGGWAIVGRMLAFVVVPALGVLHLGAFAIYGALEFFGKAGFIAGVGITLGTCWWIMQRGTAVAMRPFDQRLHDFTSGVLRLRRLQGQATEDR